ncbi:MAG: hypothetical protein K9M45_01615 [Kiritimatiellales bacterium]|nr:hypothetical protein [Kiritimatiellales bacterium]
MSGNLQSSNAIEGEIGLLHSGGSAAAGEVAFGQNADGNTFVKEESTLLSDQAKIISGKNIEAALADMVFSDTGEVVTGIKTGGDYNSGMSIGNNSSLFIDSMDENTKAIIDTAFAIVNENTTQFLESAGASPAVTDPTATTIPTVVTVSPDSGTSAAGISRGWKIAGIGILVLWWLWTRRKRK